MRKSIIKILKYSACTVAFCMPLYGMANVKQESIEVIDLDTITITETGNENRQVVETKPQKTGEETTKRVVAKKSQMTDLDKKKFLDKANKVVADANFMLNKAQAHAFYPELQQKLSTAKAVFIFPSLLKASFFIGVGGGDGLLLVRDENNNWSYPSFYTSSKAGFGLQFGASSNSIITVIQNQKALDTILNRQFKVDAGLDAAVGDVGDGQAFSFNKSVSTYSINKGATIGVSFDGQSIAQKYEMNEAYYDASGATTQTIIYDGVYSNANADILRNKLNEL